jgi:hypothetical protein
LIQDFDGARQFTIAREFAPRSETRILWAEKEEAAVQLLQPPGTGGHLQGIVCSSIRENNRQIQITVARDKGG